MDMRHKLSSILTDDFRIPHAIGERSISVKPSQGNGYEVELICDPNDIVVRCDLGWHEHFGIGDEAIECFLCMLSDGYRLRISRNGWKPWRWRQESLRGGHWVGTGWITYPFAWRPWGHKDELVLQNDRISLDALKEWDWRTELRASAEAINAGRLEEARSRLNCVLNEAAEAKAYGGLREEALRQLALIDADAPKRVK